MDWSEDLNALLQSLPEHDGRKLSALVDPKPVASASSQPELAAPEQDTVNSICGEFILPIQNRREILNAVIGMNDTLLIMLETNAYIPPEALALLTKLERRLGGFEVKYSSAGKLHRKTGYSNYRISIASA